MMQAPTLAAIHVAELRVARSGRNARAGLLRARTAFRAVLARPSTLALTAGAAGMLGFWIARHPRPGAASSSEGVGVATTASAAGLVLAFIVRYGVQYLPFIFQKVRAARQERAARAGPELSE